MIALHSPGWVKLVVVTAVIWNVVLPTVFVLGKNQKPSDELDMWEYCREAYGSLSVYDPMNDQCLCATGSSFDGKRCVPDQALSPSGSGGMHLGEDKMGHLHGAGGLQGGHGQKHQSGENPFAMQWASGKHGGHHGSELDISGGTVAEGMGLDMMQMENSQLHKSLQNMRGSVDNLNLKMNQERVQSEAILQAADRSLKEANQEVSRLAKEKEELSQRMMDMLQSGRGGINKGASEEMERLRKQNDELLKELKAAEKRSNSTAARLQAMQDKLDEQRLREQELLRELRELKSQVQGGVAVRDGQSKGGSPSKGTAGSALDNSKNPSDLDRKCQQKFGPNAIFDGKNSCKCRSGFVVKDKKCIPIVEEAEEDGLCSIDGGAPGGSCSTKGGAQDAHTGGAHAGGGMKLPPNLGLGGRSQEDTSSSNRGRKDREGTGAGGGMGLGAVGGEGQLSSAEQQLMQMLLGQQQLDDGKHDGQHGGAHARAGHHKGVDDALETRHARGQKQQQHKGMDVEPAQKQRQQQQQQQQQQHSKKTKQEDRKEKYDADCKKQFGPHARFDGEDSCECVDGYKVSNGECVPIRGGGSAAAPAGKGGASKGAAMESEDDGIDEDALRELRATFDMYDSDRDGFISERENLEVDKQLHGDAYDEESSLASFREFEASGDRKVSWAEFRGGLVKQQREAMELYTAECKKMHGPHAMFDGMESCTCEDGYTPDSQDQCVPERGGGGLEGILKRSGRA